MNKFFLYLRTEAFRKNLLIAIGSIFALVLVTYFSLDIYTRHGQSIPVPKLKGMQVEKAIELLEQQGLSYSIITIYQADQPPGIVVEQDPDPNTSVKTNRTVLLTVITRESQPVPFPDIIDKTFVEAQALLNNAGLKVGDTVYQPDIARDRVLQARITGQTLRTGESIPKGSRITLVLGDGGGSSEVNIPNLTGLTLSEAAFALNGALTLGNINWQGAVKDSANAVIIRQIPVPNDTIKVSKGSTIDVVLSNERK